MAILGVLPAILTALLWQASSPSQENKAPTISQTTQANTAMVKDSQDTDDPKKKLPKIRRIFVESFGEDSISKQIQAMVVSSLTETKRFIVTENKEKADAILKGSGLEKTSQELHSNSEATAAGSAAGGHSGSVSGSWVNGTGSVSGSSTGGFASRAMAIEDSSTTTETINDARVGVRLVDRDGDVIWATTQESKGAKYKGASADVAEKVVKQLLKDMEKLEKTSDIGK